MFEQNQKITVLHIITGLDTGGAEAMLLKLIESHNTLVNSCLIVLSGRGALSQKIDQIKIPVLYLNLERQKLPTMRAIRELIKFSKGCRPNLIQGWMYHGNLAASFVSLILKGKVGLLWNIRQTLSEPSRETRMTNWIIRFGSFLSRLPNTIIYNSQLSIQQHERLGYHKSKSLLIHNGFELENFRPSSKNRKQVRKELGIPESSFVIGHVARFHPMKNHEGMLRAARITLNHVPNVFFLFVGHKVNEENIELIRLVKSLKLETHVRLLGERSDVPKIMNTFDLFALSSAWGEGFPNVVGEAMASGVPCVVTDVGETRHVTGKYGTIVPPSDSAAFAEGILEKIRMKPEDMYLIRKKSRAHIERNFKIENIANQYLKVYKEMATY